MTPAPGSDARAQRGAALPLFLFAFFPLIGLFYVVHGAGWKTTNRLIMQNAADAAALSSAAVTAHALDQLAFLNSVQVAIASTQAVVEGVEGAFVPELERATAICASQRHPQWVYYCTLAASMGRSAPRVLRGLGADTAGIVELSGAVDHLTRALVADTFEWATRTAEGVAHDNGMGGVVVHTRPKFPFEIQHRTQTDRVEPLALDSFRRRVVPVDPFSFASHRPTQIYPRRIRRRAEVQEVPQALPEQSLSEEAALRSALAHTVLVYRKSDDEHIRGRMVAAGLPFGRPPLFGARMDAEVAVARAEPYFAAGEGGPDDRPGWSARLRPLCRSGEDATVDFQRVATAFTRGHLSGDWLAGQVCLPTTVQ